MISAIIPTHNETENLPGLRKSLEGVDDVILMDDSSTDGTQKMAESYGWRVFDRADIPRDTATHEDVERFKARWGFEPEFKPGDRFLDMSVIRNRGASLAKNDWVLCIDADERVIWDMEKIKKLAVAADMVYCNFVHTRDSGGKPVCEFKISKLYNRAKATWKQRLHEVVVPCDGARITHMENEVMRIDHHQKPKDRNNLPAMEYAVMMDDRNSRMVFYLGREYGYGEKNDKATKLLEHYLSLPDGWDLERGQAEIFLGRSTKDINWFLKATRFNRREPFYEVGFHYYQQGDFQRASVWFRAALEIPFSNEYITDSTLYTWRLHDVLSVAYSRIGKLEEAREQWQEAYKKAPQEETERMISNAKILFRE